MVAFLLIPTLGFAVWVLAEAGGQTKIDPATLSLARQNAGGSITAITGTEHTIYHANDPLPEAKAHREDGKLTLAWFTTSSCKECQDEVFVHTVMKDYRDEIAFMEKELGREPAAARLGVKEVPTFVFLDKEGVELARFTDAADETAFRAEIEKVLNRGQ